MSNFETLVYYPGESSGREGELDWGRVVPLVDAATATETAAAAVGGARGDDGGTATGAVAGTGTAAAGTVLGDCAEVATAGFTGVTRLVAGTLAGALATTAGATF